MHNVFVPESVVGMEAVRFEWSDWDPYAAVGEPESSRIETLGLIGDRPLIAYALASAEWVVRRFTRLSDDPRPLQFLEASWAFLLSFEYEPPPESNEAEWKGPVRGSIDLALMTVLNTINSTQGGKAEVDAGLEEQIARHVLERATEFEDWAGAVTLRLIEHFPREQDSDRRMVPRSFFDLSHAYDERAVDAEVESYLRELRPEGNPFLIRRR